MQELSFEQTAKVQGGIGAAPAGAIAGGVIGGASYLAGGGRSAIGFGTAVVYGGVGGAMTASGAGLAMQLFGGGMGAFGGWLAGKAGGFRTDDNGK